ncbi:hypothetical protein D3C85_1000730 [compost metagenome]
MITSTSLNASFTAKLVHASNVAIATESYCEVVTGKGRPSVLVEFIADTPNSPVRLVFTHISGQDCTGLCWDAVKAFVILPTSHVEHVQAGAVEHYGYQFLSFYLLACLLILASMLGWLSIGSAVLLGGFIVIMSRIALPVLNVLKTPSRSFSDRLEPSIA